MRQIALLRGINLASHRRVSMPELRKLLDGLGYGDVRTLLQSGNVVLTAPESGERLARRLEKEIEDGLGIDPAVVVRSRDELAAVVEANPFADLMTDGRFLQVSFLAGDPDPGYVEELAATDLGDERVAVLGRELYAWYPQGMASPGSRRSSSSAGSARWPPRETGTPSASSWHSPTNPCDAIAAIVRPCPRSAPPTGRPRPASASSSPPLTSTRRIASATSLRP